MTQPIRERAGAASRPPISKRLFNKTIAHSAPALIAAKPVKPCDGGIFGALDLLLFSQ